MADDLRTGGVSPSLANKGHHLSSDSIKSNYDQLFHHQKMSILCEMQRLARLKGEDVPRSFSDAWVV